MERVNAAVDPVRDNSNTVAVSGQPAFLAALETFFQTHGRSAADRDPGYCACSS
jgi:hypothetical protein